MRNLLLMAILFFTASMQAAGFRIYVTLGVTNVPTNGLTMTLNGSTRTWTNNAPPTPSVSIQTTNSIANSTTNLYTHILSYGFSGFTLQWVSSNQIMLVANTNLVPTLSFGGPWGWATSKFTTNVIYGATPLTVPYEAESNALRIVQQSHVITNMVYATTTVSSVSAPFTNFPHSHRVSNPPMTNMSVYGGTNAPQNLKATNGTLAYMLGGTNVFDDTVLSNVTTMAFNHEMRWNATASGDWFSMSANTNGATGVIFSLYTPAGRTLFNYFQLFGLFIGDNLTPTFISDLQVTNTLIVLNGTIQGGSFTGAVSAATLDATNATIRTGNLTGAVVTATSSADLTGLTMRSGNATGTVASFSTMIAPSGQFNGGFHSNYTFAATAGGIGTLWATQANVFTLNASNATLDAVLLHSAVSQFTNIVGSNFISGGLNLQAGAYSSLAAGAATTNVISAATNVVTIVSGNSADCSVQSMQDNGVTPSSPRWVITVNGTTFNQTYLHESGVETVAGRRFKLPGGNNIQLPSYGSILWFYSTADSRWLAIAASGASASATNVTFQPVGLTNSTHFDLTATNTTGGALQSKTLSPGNRISLTNEGGTNIAVALTVAWGQLWTDQLLTDSNTVTVAGTFYRWTNQSASTLTNNVASSNATNLITTIAGYYEVSFDGTFGSDGSISGSTQQSTNSVFTNGVRCPVISSQPAIDNPGGTISPQALAASGIVYLPAGTVVDLRSTLAANEIIRASHRRLGIKLLSQ